MKKILVNYNFIPDKSWIGDDYLIYDRSDSKDYLKDFDQSKIEYEENIGQVDYPKLSYLIENYDSLPDVFLWGKTNLFKFISEEEWEEVKDNKVFTPLLTKYHRIYSDGLGPVNLYDEGIYHERNTMLYGLPSKHAESFHDWVKLFDLPDEQYIPFAPGGNYILTKDTVHKHPKELYARMRDMLNHDREPAEAHMCERSYYYLWR